jgi:hypothetical protein
MDKEPDEPVQPEGAARDAWEAELPLLREAEPSPADLDALFRQCEQSVTAERGLRAWLRARSTAQRRALASAVAVAFAALASFAFGRPDMDVYPAARMAAVLIALAAGVALSLQLAMRPLHRPALSARAAATAVAATLLGVLLLYALPAAHSAHPASLHAEGWQVLLQRATPCLAIGLAIGAVFYGVLALLDRGGSYRAPAMAAAAGLAANLSLQLHCPVTAPLHMVVGHLGVALLLVAAALLLRGRSGG